ncbi:hypothetical protein RCL1_003564 [Eukaryota sp. TZLM3-RCL]
MESYIVSTNARIEARKQWATFGTLGTTLFHNEREVDLSPPHLRPKEDPNQNVQLEDSNVPRCHYCKSADHASYECPDRDSTLAPPPSGDSTYVPPSRRLHDSGEEYAVRVTNLPTTMNKWELEELFETVCFFTNMPDEMSPKDIREVYNNIQRIAFLPDAIKSSEAYMFFLHLCVLVRLPYDIEQEEVSRLFSEYSRVIRLERPVFGEGPKVVAEATKYANAKRPGETYKTRPSFIADGHVERCHIAKDRETGVSRGFAFITFSTKAAAEKAIQLLHDYPIGHSVLAVDWSQPRK